MNTNSSLTPIRPGGETAGLFLNKTLENFALFLYLVSSV